MCQFLGLSLFCCLFGRFVSGIALLRAVLGFLCRPFTVDDPFSPVFI